MRILTSHDGAHLRGQPSLHRKYQAGRGEALPQKAKVYLSKLQSKSPGPAFLGGTQTLPEVLGWKLHFKRHPDRARDLPPAFPGSNGAGGGRAA